MEDYDRQPDESSRAVILTLSTEIISRLSLRTTLLTSCCLHSFFPPSPLSMSFAFTLSRYSVTFALLTLLVALSTLGLDYPVFLAFLISFPLIDALLCAVKYVSLTQTHEQQLTAGDGGHVGSAGSRDRCGWRRRHKKADGRRLKLRVRRQVPTQPNLPANGFTNLDNLVSNLH